MCDPGQPAVGPAAAGFPAAGQPASAGQPAGPGLPASTGEALAVLEGALSFLAAADAGALTAGEQADVLRGLERAESVRTAARSSVLAAFTAGRGFEADGQGSAQAWLRWQTRVTGAAAAAAAGWARRLAGHPAVRAALAAGGLSSSWARQVCDWSDLLPAAARGDADVILVAAVAGARRWRTWGRWRRRYAAAPLSRTMTGMTGLVTGRSVSVRRSAARGAWMGI